MVQFDATQLTPGAWLDGGEIVLDGEAVHVRLPRSRCAACTIWKTRWPPRSMAKLAGATHAQIRAAVMTFPGRRTPARIRARARRSRLVQRFQSHQRRRDAQGDRGVPGRAVGHPRAARTRTATIRPLARPLKEKAQRRLLIGAAADKIAAASARSTFHGECAGRWKALLRHAHRRAHPETPCCWLPPAPASINSKTSNIAAANSSGW